MLGAILSGFIVSLVIFFLGKFVKPKFNFIYASIPLFLFIYFVQYLLNIKSGNSILFHTDWVPQYKMNLDFKLDGLSLLFSLLITGIGTLIYLYTHKYLYGNKNIDKFFAYISMFMASMLGVVLSDNVIALIVFWELTSISSFFLISFNTDDETSRKNAQLSLAVTGLGGFFLLAGLLLLGNIAGTYNISAMLAQKELILSSPYLPLLIGFILMGALTKSAIFPFHFWLPNAMKAPTPVSAYLHSATMVKAGIYLMARLSPIFDGYVYWNTTLLVLGAITMLYAAINTLFKTDLKGVLAYSTIAVLGMLTMLVGIGSEMALKALVTFIAAHALYKASLFMVTGIIDHEAHTRNVTLLSGLKKVMPPVFIAGVITVLSNAGIPLSFGFIGKELIYESVLQLTEQSPYWMILVGITVVSNVLIAYAGYQVGIKPFIGALPQKFSKIKPVSIFLALPPILLSIAGIFYGIFPQLADGLIIQAATTDVVGFITDLPLKIWHGFNLTFILSLATIVAAILLYLLVKPSTDRETFIDHNFNSIKPDRVYNSIKLKIKQFAGFYTRSFHSGYLRIYIMTIILFIIGIVGYKLFTEVPIKINTASLSGFRLYELVVFFIIIIAILFTITTQSRLTAVASMSIVGYCICLLFVFYGAPDLAMTQFTIDTLTLVLFVLVLFKLPPFMKYKGGPIIFRDAIIAIAFGALITIITLQALVSPADKEVSKYYAENAYQMAKGKNVVNVILVDFRGFDTMIESIVLTIAALGVYSLLKLQVSSSDKE
jgi:multicomponent Na+:H+ antiporter subunit A